MSDITPVTFSEQKTEVPGESVSESTNEIKNTNNLDVQTELTAVKQQISEKKWESAIDSLSNLLENLSKSEQMNSPHIAETYYLYGKSLFRLSQTQNDVFGSAVREKQAEYAALQAIDEEENDAEMTEATNDTVGQKEEDSKESAPVGDEAQEHTDGQQEQEEQNGDPEAMLNAFASIFEQAHAFKEQMEANGDIDTADDRVLAWESLETARSLLSESTDVENRKLLADTHFLLAELQMEDEAFDGASGDFDAAIRIYSELKCSPRMIASVYFLWAISSQYNGKNMLAKEQFETASELLLKELAQISRQDVDVGGPKSEAVSLLVQKDQVLERAKKFGEEQGNEVQRELEELSTLFRETFERIDEAATADEQKMEVERVANDENDKEAANGVTTVGFEPMVPASGLVNDLGVVKKKKRTADDAGLSEPTQPAKKQRVEE